MSKKVKGFIEQLKKVERPIEHVPSKEVNVFRGEQRQTKKPMQGKIKQKYHDPKGS